MDKKILKTRVEEINDIIYRYFPEPDEYNAQLCEAMAYSVRAGGKRLRPMIMQETFRIFSNGQQEPEVLHAFMAAIEFIHTYSLIHDDLPAMDNDDYRRGLLTVHAKYGEAAGILTGDALLNYAYETIFKAASECDDRELCARAVKAACILSSKAGLYGMVGGQYIDVYSEKHPEFVIDEDCLNYINKNKTSALLEASMMVGAIIAGADDEEVEKAEMIAGYIGIAFQIRDDILDTIGDPLILGKPVGSDEKNDKCNYVSMHGLGAAQKAVIMYSEKALEIYDGLKNKNQFLRELFKELVIREK